MNKVVRSSLFYQNLTVLRLIASYIVEEIHSIKSNLLLYSLYYAEACYEFAISTSLRPGNSAHWEEIL